MAQTLMDMARAQQWPSVTTVLKLGGCAENFERFASAPARRDEGRDLHEAVAALINRDVEPTIAPSIRDEARHAAEQITRQVTVSRVEWRDAHPLGFTGQLDLFGTLARSIPQYPVIVDVKRGTKQPEHALQLAAYALIAGHALHIEPQSIKRACYYSKSRTWQWYDSTQDFAVFLGTLANVHWRIANRRLRFVQTAAEIERVFGDMHAGPDERTDDNANT